MAIFLTRSIRMCARSICRSHNILMVSALFVFFILSWYVYANSTRTRHIINEDSNTYIAPPSIGYSSDVEDIIPTERSSDSYSESSVDDLIINHLNSIHIVISVDTTLIDGLVAMVQSVIEHTGDNDVMIHVVVNSTNREAMENRITCSISIPDNVKIKYKVFNLPEKTKSLIKTSKKYLRSSANFARFYFAQLFPDLSCVLYLDVDVIVNRDISKLWKELVSAKNKLLVVAASKTRPCMQFFKPNTIPLFYKRYNKWLNESKCPDFNAGVVGYNLDKWRNKNITNEIRYWMGERYKQLLWGFGTQPLLFVVSVDDYKMVSRKWNYLGLAYEKHSLESVENGFILHWNGLDKPWGQNVASGKEKQNSHHKHDYIWHRYNRKVCGGSGQCMTDQETDKPVCHCEQGYQGTLCGQVDSKTIEKDSVSQTSLKLSNPVHIVISVDGTVIDGLVAMVQSVIEHTGNNDVMIHIVVNSTNRQEIKNRITCSISIPDNVEIEYRVFNLPVSIKNMIKTSKKYLQSTANYARFYFDQIFPELSHVLYLDVDLIVQHDISVLWNELVSAKNKLLVVVASYSKPCTRFFKPNMTDLYYKRYHKHLDKSRCPDFNGGVIGFNLDKWRRKKITDEIEYWMGERYKQLLWGFGTQPLLYVISVNDCKTVSGRWNVYGIAYHQFSKSKIEKAFILHWNGLDKPWGQSMGKGEKSYHTYDYTWKKYNRKICGGRGMCVMKQEDTKKAGCVCDAGYTGEHCNDHV